MLALNRQVLRRLDFAAVADRLPGGATEAFWLAVRGNLDLLKEARGWWDVVAGTIVPPVIEGARELLLTAGSLLPAEPWDNAVWTTGSRAGAGHRPERRGAAAPLRLALTGEDSGPDLADLAAADRPFARRKPAGHRLRVNWLMQGIGLEWTARGLRSAPGGFDW